MSEARLHFDDRQELEVRSTQRNMPIGVFVEDKAPQSGWGVIEYIDGEASRITQVYDDEIFENAEHMAKAHAAELEEDSAKSKDLTGIDVSSSERAYFTASKVAQISLRAEVILHGAYRVV